MEDDAPYVEEDTRSEEDLERLICEADAEEDAVQGARCRVALGRLYRCEMARFDEALQAHTHTHTHTQTHPLTQSHTHTHTHPRARTHTVITHTCRFLLHLY